MVDGIGNIMTKTILFDGKKSITLDQYPPDAWDFITGGPTPKEADYYKFIPTLYRGVQLRAQAVASMPFRLMKGEREYDTSADWQNKVGFMPNPTQLLHLIEAALTMTGTAYLFRERSRVATKELRYIVPGSVTPQIDPLKGLTGFKRPVNGVDKNFTTDDIIYFWLPDPYVEEGPPKNYPAAAAGISSSVLLAVGYFSSGYIDHGMIRAMLFTVTGNPPESEKQKLKSWGKTFLSGMRNVFNLEVVNADTVKPVIIGEGLKELENVTLTQEMREDIAVAIGIPMSILFAGAANYATASQDDLNFLSKTVVPECDFITSILNEQIFEPLKLKWKFMPETLDAFQEDENNRAAALKTLVDSGIPLLMAMDLLGFELTDKQKAELKKLEAEPEPETPSTLEGQPNITVSQVPQLQANNETNYEEELRRWERKSLNAIRRGSPAQVAFESTVLSPKAVGRIYNRLAQCKSEDDIRGLFALNWYFPPEDNKAIDSPDITALVTELKRANDLLETASS